VVNVGLEVVLVVFWVVLVLGVVVTMTVEVGVGAVAVLAVKPQQEQAELYREVPLQAEA
jgi:hypothetical protein